MPHDGRYRADRGDISQLAPPLKLDAATTGAVLAASKRGDQAEVARLIAAARLTTATRPITATRLDGAARERAALDEMNRALENAHRR